MAYIHKHKDGWRAQVAKMGVRRSAVWPSKREATEWATRVESEIASGKYNQFPTKTLAQAIEKYLKTVSSTKSDAVEWERRRFSGMAEFFGLDTQVQEITSERIGEWRDWRLAGSDERPAVKASTVLREVNLLRNLFTVAVDEWEWLESNPFKGVRLPKDVPPREKVWGWREIRRVIRHGQAGGEKTRQVAAAFHIALRTGMRLSEVLSGRYDRTARVVVLGKTKTTQAGQIVKVPVTRAAAKVLDRSPVFTVGPNEASALFCKLARDSMVRGLTFHDARATALTLMSRKMDVLTLSKISRHRDLNLLMNTYFRETPEQVAQRI